MPPSKGGGGGGCGTVAAAFRGLCFQPRRPSSGALLALSPQLQPQRRSVPRPPCRPLMAAAAAQRFSRRARRKREEEEEGGEAAAAGEEEDPLSLLLAKDSKRRRERADSVSAAMLDDRRRHLRRVREAVAAAAASSTVEAATAADPATLRRIRALGLGRKQTGKDAKQYRQGSKSKDGAAGASSSSSSSSSSSGIGAAGFATYLAASSGGTADGWPTFKHMLPEVAFAGHSNCGKSSLVNAVAGLAPRRGPARVSDRAGWTDAVFFFQLGKKPPVLTLADLPGYGHAVASTQQRRRWRRMARDYLTGRRVLSLCCVLVDCVRGLCREDQDLLRFLQARGVPTKVVLTKADLLDEAHLAASHAVVRADLVTMGLAPMVDSGRARGGMAAEGEGEGEAEEGGEGNEAPRPRRRGTLVVGDGGSDGGVAMVSAGTGAGVTALWRELVAATRGDVVMRGDIGIHRAAVQ